jgi:uncharacterized protein YecE (DUF72 family)
MYPIPVNVSRSPVVILIAGRRFQLQHMGMARQRLFIGTSGWLYNDWKGKFYPETIKQKDWFRYYVSKFSTVEINSTFYHMPRSSTIESWRDDAPKDFKYVIKLNRYLTHTKRLKPDEDFDQWLTDFFKLISPLGKKLAAVIVQLPPGLQADKDRLQHLLDQVNRIERVSGMSFPIAMEYRHGSWFNDEIFQLMREHNTANVINSSPDRWPASKAVTANFAYVRFHGSTKLYASSYSNAELTMWAEFIRKGCKDCKHVFCFFNNDVNAYAPENAQRLVKLLQS